jgi:hypothetical protein
MVQFFWQFHWEHCKFSRMLNIFKKIEIFCKHKNIWTFESVIFALGVILKLSVIFAFDTAFCFMCNCENDQEKLLLGKWCLSVNTVIACKWKICKLSQGLLFCVVFNTECFRFISVYLNMGSKKCLHMLIGLEP